MPDTLSNIENNSEPTIVILDDSQADIALIKIHIKKHLPDAIFVTAESKAELLKKVEWAMPSIIISDYNLPDTNGLEVLLLMKEKYPNIPFLFVTGMLNDEEKTAEAILRGADGYILKHNFNKVGEKVIEILSRNALSKSDIMAKQAIKDEIAFRSGKIIELLKGHAPHEKIAIEFDALLRNLKAVSE